MASRKWVYRFLLPLLVSSFVLAGVGTRTVRADSSLALDGLGVNDCQGQFCEQSQLLTTTQGNDVILVIVGTCCNVKVSSINDDSGLAFTERLSYASQTNGHAIWEYFAIAPAPLDSDNITVVADQCCYTILGMQALAISGADTTTIFDQDPSVPSTVSCPGPDCGDCSANWQYPGTCSTSIQTTTWDFVIASIPINDAGPCGPSYPNGSVPGFTNLTNQNNRFEVDYAITTEPQSHVQVDCSGTNAIAIVVDAIMASS